MLSSSLRIKYLVCLSVCLPCDDSFVTCYWHSNLVASVNVRNWGRCLAYSVTVFATLQSQSRIYCHLLVCLCPMSGHIYTHNDCDVSRSNSNLVVSFVFLLYIFQICIFLNIIYIIFLPSFKCFVWLCRGSSFKLRWLRWITKPGLDTKPWTVLFTDIISSHRVHVRTFPGRTLMCRDFQYMHQLVIGWC